jgi:hypothetical protein
MIVVVPLALFAAYFGPKLLEKARKKYTYTRLGYAKLIDRGQDNREAAIVLFFIYATWILGTIGIFAFENHEFALYEPIYMPILVGLCLAMGCVLAYFKFGGRRFLAYIPICLGMAVYFAWLSASPVDSTVSTMMTIAGLVLLASGLSVYYRFIKTNPPLQQETAGEK